MVTPRAARASFLVPQGTPSAWACGQGFTQVPVRSRLPALCYPKTCCALWLFPSHLARRCPRHCWRDVGDLLEDKGCPELSLQERLSPNETSPEFLSQVVNSTALSDAACNVQGWPVLRGGLRCHPYRVSALRRRQWGTLVLSSAWGRGGEGNGAASGAFVLGRLVTTARSKVWERGRVRSTPRCLHWGGVKQNSGADPSSQLVPP